MLGGVLCDGYLGAALGGDAGEAQENKDDYIHSPWDTGGMACHTGPRGKDTRVVKRNKTE